MNLDQMYVECAKRCFYAGIPCDDSPNGRIHSWVKRHVAHRPETAFFIVLGICAELARLELQEKPLTPKYCKGQMRLFEIENRLIPNGYYLAVNPRYGRKHD